MKQKMVLLDVDGTIISGQHIVPQSTVDAIQSIRRSGNLAVFFTGRPYSHMEENVLNIGFDGCICTMGAYVRIGERVLRDEKPSEDAARRIVSLVRACRLDAAYESSAGIAFDGKRELPDFLKGLKAHFAGRGLQTDADIDAPGFTFEKLCVWSNEQSDMARFAREAVQHLDIAGQKQNMMELVAKGVSAGESVGQVMRHFGVSKEDCYAIGDSITDLPMLRCARHTIAMGEAPEELKAQVEYTTTGIMENGLAAAMAHYGLIS